MTGASAAVWSGIAQRHAAAPALPLIVAAGEPAFHQVLNTVQILEQLQQLFAVVASEQCSKLDGRLALLV